MCFALIIYSLKLVSSLGLNLLVLVINGTVARRLDLRRILLVPDVKHSLHSVQEVINLNRLVVIRC